MSDNCPNHQDTKTQIERVETDLRLITAEIATIKQSAVSVEASSKAAHKRLDESVIKIDHVEQGREDIIRLAMSIEKLAESIKTHNNSLDEHEDRISKMEQSAGKYALKMWQIVAGLLLTGVVGFVLSHFGIGG